MLWGVRLLSSLPAFCPIVLSLETLCIGFEITPCTDILFSNWIDFLTGVLEDTFAVGFTRPCWSLTVGSLHMLLIRRLKMIRFHSTVCFRCLLRIASLDMGWAYQTWSVRESFPVYTNSWVAMLILYHLASGSLAWPRSLLPCDWRYWLGSVADRLWTWDLRFFVWLPVRVCPLSVLRCCPKVAYFHLVWGPQWAHQ